MNKTICLNMIVKNESDVIVRCLLSLKSIIDYWVIVDTGSSDHTKELIKETLRDVPGCLYERPWIHFSHNRNEALALARGKADYILFMDADEQLRISHDFDKSQLNENFYLLEVVERSYTNLYKISLIKDLPCWFWKGMFHEAIAASESLSGRLLETIVRYGATKDGNQSKNPRKFLQEAQWIEDALAKDPTNSRYVFYLAQSYGNAQQYETSLQWYEKRVCMGDDKDEIFWSFYCMGMIHQELGSPSSVWMDCYTKAYKVDPSRAEPIFRLALYFQETKQHLIGLFLAEKGLSLAKPTCCGYFHPWVYDFALLYIWATCAEALGRKEEALNAYRSLLTKNIPDDMREKATEFMKSYP